RERRDAAADEQRERQREQRADVGGRAGEEVVDIDVECKSLISVLFAVGLLAFSAAGARASPAEDDVRATFDQFVKAQNAHDVAAVREVLLDSPSFLWVTRGAPIWGRDAALPRWAGEARNFCRYRCLGRPLCRRSEALQGTVESLR